MSSVSKQTSQDDELLSSADKQLAVACKRTVDVVKQSAPDEKQMAGVCETSSRDKEHSSTRYPSILE